jgi:adenylate kinase family enzyme
MWRNESSFIYLYRQILNKGYIYNKLFFMISLMQLLREVQGTPKAIILAGAPGAGKGFILKGLDLGGLKVFNLDNTFVDLLKQANISLDLKSLGPEDRSAAAQAMVQATTKLKKETIPQAIANQDSFILDGTASSVKQTSELKSQLENAGYDVFMLYVYTDLERSLQQNQDRFEKSGGTDRSLAPAIVLRTWAEVTKNYDTYKSMFGNNFASVANTLKDEKLKDLESIVDKYLRPFTPQDTKEKDPKAQARSQKAKEQLSQEVSALLQDEGVANIINNSVSKEEAQSKIQQFLS